MKYFLQDIRRKQQLFAKAGYPVSMLRCYVSDGTSANFLYRLTQCLMNWHLAPLALLCQWLNRLVNGCVIGAKADFGAGLVLMHPVGIVINGRVTGGSNITIESGVVIGDEKGRSPRLGNNVFIGAGAKIIGDVRIGDNVNIGANAVVIRDVPDNSTAVGIPARIITKDN